MFYLLSQACPGRGTTTTLDMRQNPSKGYPVLYKRGPPQKQTNKTIKLDDFESLLPLCCYWESSFFMAMVWLSISSSHSPTNCFRLNLNPVLPTLNPNESTKQPRNSSKTKKFKKKTKRRQKNESFTASFAQEAVKSENFVLKPGEKQIIANHYHVLKVIWKFSVCYKVHSMLRGF